MFIATTETPAVRPTMESFPVDSPFAALRIASHAPLRELEHTRSICPGCNKTSKYFCYRCMRVTETIKDQVPQVHLPLSIHIVKHSQELDGKSTAIHAKLLAPSRVFIHQFDRTTASTDGDLVQMIAADPTGFVILFPDASAVGLEELSAEDLSRVHSGIFIDGTWSQATAISRLEPYSSLRRVRINPTLTTVFWRYQNLGVHCLATIEAIYYFVREYAALRADASGHDHDNLLYFYSFFYHLIQRTYRDNPTRQYTTKHRANYIA